MRLSGGSDGKQHGVDGGAAKRLKVQETDGDKENAPPSGTQAPTQQKNQLYRRPLNAPFKMPLANYQPSISSRTATLGPRRMMFNGSSFLSGLTKMVNDPCFDKKQPSIANDSTSCEPLLIFDPELEDNEAKRSMSKVYVDGFLAAKLRPHQRDGVQFMLHCLAGLKKDGFCGCVLCDGMGLGKTFQSITILWTLLTAGVNGKPTCKMPLILCPSSLVMNWGKELQRWLGDRVDPLVLDDTRAACVKDALASFGGLAAMRARKPQVLVMSYNTYRIHKEAVYKKGIDLLICDEAHFLKNGESQITQAVAGIPATRRLLLSGTPIQNDLIEFYTLFNVALPGLLGEASTFRRQYEIPILRGQDADATDAEVQRGIDRSTTLLQTCGAFMLRRTCNIMQQYLPEKVEQVLFCRMSPLQLKLYSHFLNSAPVQKALYNRVASKASEQAKQARSGVQVPSTGPGTSSEQPGGQQPAPGRKSGVGQGEGKASGRTSGAGVMSAPRDRSEDLSVLAAITAVKKLCCHPDLIYDMFKPMASVVHRISGRASGPMLPPAAQQERNTSVLTGFENCLPLFNDSTIYPAYSTMSCQPYHSGKVMVLVNLLKAIRQTHHTDKVVLVSNYTEALDILYKLCQSQGWNTLRLDGSLTVKQRQPLVDRFNDPRDPSFVFLLSSKAGGVGLNIIGANRLILFDPDWNPANDLQAMARVWREGQKKQVWIYRLLTTGSIEEKVYQRQLAKQGLSKTIVDDTGNQSRQFSTEELRSLFKVDPDIRCDTHAAIKCKCDATVDTMQQKAKQLAATRTAAATASSADADDMSKPAEEAGISDWAHLLDVSHSPDAVWQHISGFIREKFVTFLMSDHITGGTERPASGKGRGAECDGEEEESDDGSICRDRGCAEKDCSMEEEGE